MKRRSLAALIAALAVIAVGILISFFLSLTAKNTGKYTISLPGQSTATIDDMGLIREKNRETVQAVTIDEKNAQAVIGALERPEQYQCTYVITYRYGENTAAFTGMIAVNGARSYAQTVNDDGQAMFYALLTDRWSYVWGEDEIYRRFPRKSRDADLYACAPTYEDLLDIPQEQILKAYVEELDGQLCLAVLTGDPMTDEWQEWRILVDSGILLTMEAKNGIETTYSAVLGTLSLNTPEERLFLLPDERSPEA
ncbi:MAG: hypothetical protein IJT76_05005 [Clostridia bacterium]|nr:hypothetical protein [Clostridia bacterium]